MKRIHAMCSVPACTSRSRCAGLLCKRHFSERWAGQTPPTPEKRRQNSGLNCSCSGCCEPAYARVLCRAHSFRFYAARAAGTLDLGHWREPIARLHRRRTYQQIQGWCLIARVPAVQAYADARGLQLGEALVELALQQLAWRSAREREEVRPEAWSRSGPDAMEAV